MLYIGEFLTQGGETCRVEITTGGDRTTRLDIGGAGSGVLFTANPVETTCEVNDTFDHLFRTSATIRLLTRGYIPDLFSCSAFEAEVVIYVGNTNIFTGFVDPRTYSQPFSDVYDELELNCIDLLSALQYVPYGGEGVAYDTLRERAGQRTFLSIVEEILSHSFAGHGSCLLTWDGSLQLPDSTGTPFSGLSISELLFLGDDEDGKWTMQEVLEEILRYLNLHASQEGLCIRIYSLDTLKGTAPVKWQTLDGKTVETAARREVTISTAIASGTDTRLSVNEVYNRIELTCEPTDVETVVESPLDESSRISPYPAMQLYMTEYIDTLEQNAGDAGERVKKMIDNGRPLWPENIRRDWYIRMHDSMKWKFLLHGAPEARDVREYFASGRNQEEVLTLLASLPGSCLASFGRMEYKESSKDNSLTPRVDMDPCLVIAVNGNGKDTEGESYPSAESLTRSVPVAEYTAGFSGGTFSPADDETTNYIVISGKIKLMPRLQESESKAYYGKRWNEVTWPDVSGMNDTFGKWALMDFLGTNPCKNGTRIYVCRWWDCTTPYSQPVDSSHSPGFWPPVDDVQAQYPFNYSAIGNGADTISKVSVLECMLIIGDKCVVETGTQGQTSDFEWRTYKPREACADDDEYYAQSFSIGFDPKIGDNLIGEEFDIQNNLSFEMGLDLEGTAIPVRRRDKVSGKVTFRILGPVNLMWNNVTRRHRTFFRPVKWGDGNIPLMAHVSSIVVKDFEVIVATDNGLVSDTGDGDIIYVSDTDERYVNVRDDLTFRITTALTREERLKLGISDSVKLSAPVCVSTEEPLLKIKNLMTGDTAKPEQLYVDARWREWHAPRVSLEQKVRTSSGVALLENIFRHPALPGKRFWCVGMSRNVMENWTNLNLKECEQ